MGLAPGTVFAGYRIERRLGEGGMGTVYLARHPRLPRSVALKVLDAEAGLDPEYRARFEREAEMTVRLDHPNVVEIYDRGAEGELLWIAMRYVAGSDVARLIGNGLTPRRAVAVLIQAAAGLDAAHRRGLLHRDVKPANLLVTEDDDGGDHVFVADFGIARSRDDTHLTAAGELTATLAYVAPEQIDGREPDHRCDIYALGVTFYQMLTGTLPFPGRTPAEVLQAHLLAPPPRPSEKVPGLPPALDEVVRTALAKNPEDRYPDCRTMAAAALAALGSDGTGRQRTPSPTPGGTTWPSPHLAPYSPAPTIDSRHQGAWPGAAPTPRPVPPGAHTAARLPHAGSQHPHDTTPSNGPATASAPPSVPSIGAPRGTGARIAAASAAVVALIAVIAVVVLVVRPDSVSGGSPVATPATSSAGSSNPPQTSEPAARPSSGTQAPTTSSPPVNPAWGRNGALAGLLPDLVPGAPSETGYQGARCTGIDVLNNGGAPALECEQDNGIHWYAWSFRPGDPRRESTFETNIDNATTREETWQRGERSGRLRWTTYTEVGTGLLTVMFDDPERQWIVLDVSWDGHTGQDLYDLWWTPAPI